MFHEFTDSVACIIAKPRCRLSSSIRSTTVRLPYFYPRIFFVIFSGIILFCTTAFPFFFITTVARKRATNRRRKKERKIQKGRRREALTKAMVRVHTCVSLRGGATNNREQNSLDHSDAKTAVNLIPAISVSPAISTGHENGIHKRPLTRTYTRTYLHVRAMRGRPVVANKQFRRQTNETATCVPELVAIFLLISRQRLHVSRLS